MCNDIPTNYNNNINSYVTILNNLNLNDCLDIDINNHSIGRNMVDGEVEITPESEFDIISTDLWNNFTMNNNNYNNGTMIELGISYLSKDSLEIKLGKNASYIIFWDINEQALGKIILKFRDEGQKYLAYENIKNMGINTFYLAYELDNGGKIKPVNAGNFSFVCINKYDNIKNITINSNNNNNNDYQTGSNDINNNRNDNNFFYNNINNYDNNYLMQTKGPMGLQNIFATCYMNSALQSLFNVQKLSNYFLQNENNINGNQLLSSAYLGVVKNLSRLTPESQNAP